MTYNDLESELLGSDAVMNADYRGERRRFRVYLRQCLSIAVRAFDADEPPKRGALSKMVRRTYREDHGIDPITLWLLGLAIQIVVKFLIEWWFRNRDADKLLRQWQVDLAQEGA